MAKQLIANNAPKQQKLFVQISKYTQKHCATVIKYTQKHCATVINYMPL